MMHIL